jgi:peptidoglycan/LPS O-acetylase OafA/YrhL
MVDISQRPTTDPGLAAPVGRRPRHLAPRPGGPVPRIHTPPRHLAVSGQRREPPFRLGHHPAFDGLRGYGLVLVMGAHLAIHLWPSAGTWLFPPHAYVAMDVFFVLSGFLITSLLLGAFDRHGHVQLRDFLWRRAVRLLPALLLLLGALVAAAAVAYGTHTPGEWLADDLFLLGFVSNWWPLDHLPQEMSHTWSLAVEGQFYVAWSLVMAVVLACVRWRPRQVLFAVACLAVVTVAVTRAMRLADGYPAAVLYIETTARIDGPLIGAMAGIAYASGWLDRLSRRAGVWLAAVGLVGLFLVPFALDRDDNSFLFNGGFTVQSLLGAALVVGAVTLPQQGRLNRVLGLRPMVFAGTISYAVYLWHLPIFVVIHRDFGHWPVGLQIAAAVVGSFVVGWLSYRFVERPLMERVHNRRRRPAPAAAEAEAEAGPTPVEPSEPAAQPAIA